MYICTAVCAYDKCIILFTGLCAGEILLEDVQLNCEGFVSLYFFVYLCVSLFCLLELLWVPNVTGNEILTLQILCDRTLVPIPYLRH